MLSKYYPRTALSSIMVGYCYNVALMKTDHKDAEERLDGDRSLMRVAEERDFQPFALALTRFSYSVQ